MFGKNNQFTVTDDAENQHVKNRTVCLYLEEERQSESELTAKRINDQIAAKDSVGNDTRFFPTAVDS